MARASRAHVTAGATEPFGKLWKRFERAVDASGVMDDYRNHEFFINNGTDRKRKQSIAIARERKRVAEGG